MTDMLSGVRSPSFSSSPWHFSIPLRDVTRHSATQAVQCANGVEREENAEPDAVVAGLPPPRDAVPTYQSGFFPQSFTRRSHHPGRIATCIRKRRLTARDVETLDNARKRFREKASAEDLYFDGTRTVPVRYPYGTRTFPGIKTRSTRIFLY